MGRGRASRAPGGAVECRVSPRTRYELECESGAAVCWACWRHRARRSSVLSEAALCKGCARVRSHAPADRAPRRDNRLHCCLKGCGGRAAPLACRAVLCTRRRAGCSGNAYQFTVGTPGREPPQACEIRSEAHATFQRASFDGGQACKPERSAEDGSLATRQAAPTRAAGADKEARVCRRRAVLVR